VSEADVRREAACGIALLYMGTELAEDQRVRRLREAVAADDFDEAMVLTATMVLIMRLRRDANHEFATEIWSKVFVPGEAVEA
jgi:hypothetical protein